MNGIPVLSVRDVSRHYASGDSVVRALDGVSFDIHSGEVVGILGPSGSGKSTLLLIAGLLDPPTTGEIFIRGRCVSSASADIESLRDFRRDNIGFVFQKANLIPFLTAVENVALSLEIDDIPARDARSYAEHLLESVDLSHRIDNLPTRLSGGEQQRVAIARALVNQPILLIADEPTGNLDPVTSEEIMKLFNEINHMGTTIIMVTHNKDLVNAMHKRVINIEDGRIIADQEKGGYHLHV